MKTPHNTANRPSVLEHYLHLHGRVYSLANPKPIAMRIDGFHVKMRRRSLGREEMIEISPSR